MNKSFIFYADKGLVESGLDRVDCDVSISSEALIYIFEKEWGAATYQVNARYQYEKNGDPYRFDLLIRIGSLNNEGIEFKWEKPSLINRVLSKFKL